MNKMNQVKVTQWVTNPLRQRLAFSRELHAVLGRWFEIQVKPTLQGKEKLV